MRYIVAPKFGHLRLDEIQVSDIDLDLRSIRKKRNPSDAAKARSALSGIAICDDDGATTRRFVSGGEVATAVAAELSTGGAEFLQDDVQLLPKYSALVCTEVGQERQPAFTMQVPNFVECHFGRHAEPEQARDPPARRIALAHTHLPDAKGSFGRARQSPRPGRRVPRRPRASTTAPSPC